MRSAIKSWAVLLWVTMSLCVPALAGCTIITGPTTRNDTLNAVSCLSANSCVAVGSEATVTGQTETVAPAAMRWDGSPWHALAVRLPSGAVQGGLSSVSCKPGGCLAVGSYSPAQPGSFALAEYWNDSTWTPVSLAFPPGPQLPSLRAVSCVTVSQCVATGNYEKLGSAASALAATWDGHEWSWSQPPVRAGVEGSSHYLPSVSCVTSKYCVAIGNAYDARTSTTVGFTEIWNGHGWTQAYAPAAGEAGSAAGLSCAAASYCVAVGTQFAGVPAGFGQLLDGTRWTEPAMPWPRGTRSYLHGVSCAGKTCLAVGEAEPSQVANGTATHPAALTWNGATWTRQATPRGTIGTLYGVTCVTSADCVAVGSARGGNGTRTLSEFWNGTAWTIVSPT
jgi:hypothetical protein